VFLLLCVFLSLCFYFCVFISALFCCIFACFIRGSDPRSGQTKDYKIGICCFFAKHAALRRKSNDWLARNQDNVSEWGNMSTRGLLSHWASTIKIQLEVLVKCKADLIIISLKINLFLLWYSWKNCCVGVKQQPLTHSVCRYCTRSIYICSLFI